MNNKQYQVYCRRYEYVFQVSAYKHNITSVSILMSYTYQYLQC